MVSVTYVTGIIELWLSHHIMIAMAQKPHNPNARKNLEAPSLSFANNSSEALSVMKLAS